jgi:hypothetical protein
MDYHILIACTGLHIFLYVISRLFKSGKFQYLLNRLSFLSQICSSREYIYVELSNLPQSPFLRFSVPEAVRVEVSRTIILRIADND